MDTASSSKANSCAVRPTRPVSSSFWWNNGNFHDTDKYCIARYCTRLEEICYKLTVDECHEVAELQCTHEEADTRLIQCPVHAANVGLQSAMITAEDTDVMVFCLAF